MTKNFQLNQQASVQVKMDRPFSTSAGFFGVVWKQSGQNHLVFCKDETKCHRLFDSILNVQPLAQLWHITGEGQNLCMRRAA